MNNLAPVGVSTYSRINHLQQTVQALQKNTLAKETELYVFSDAPQPGDEQIVGDVRKYIQMIKGFKKVYLVTRENNGSVRNTRDGIKQLLDEYGKVIWLEDDVISTPYLLEFLNDGLRTFKKNKKIFGIGGFNVPLENTADDGYEYCLSKLFNAWGFATWNDRDFSSIIENDNHYIEMKKENLSKKIKSVHPTLHKGLKRIYEGKLQAGDYKLSYYLIKNDLYVIKPIKTLVKNVGFDGSGIHCGFSDRFDFTLEEVKMKLFIDKLPEYVDIYDTQYYNFFHPQNGFVEQIIKKISSKLR